MDSCNLKHLFCLQIFLCAVLIFAYLHLGLNLGLTVNSERDLPTLLSRQAVKTNSSAPGLGFWHDDLFLVSAYLDDRPGTGPTAAVRTILVRDTTSTPTNIMCVLRDQSGGVLAVNRSSVQPIGIGMSFFGHWYREEIVSCPVERSLRPAFVSLVPHRSAGDLRGPGDSSRARLPIRYPRRTKHRREIVNCVSVTFGRPNATRLVEWLEMLRLLGMTQVEIHGADLHPDVWRLLSRFTKAHGDGLVYLQPLRPIFSNQSRSVLLLMSPAINNCLYRNLYLFRHVAVFDIDEVIFPRRDSNYSHLIRRLLNESVQSGNTYEYTEFHFRNVYYFLDIPGGPSGNGSSMMTRFIRHADPSGPGHAIKSIVSPLACYAMHNHYCWANLPFATDVVPPKIRNKIQTSVSVDPAVGANQHYKKCRDFGVSECKKMMQKVTADRGILRFQPELDARIRQTLKRVSGDDL